MKISSYEALLSKALSDCDSFSLVWRDEFKFNAHCQQIEKDLRPYLAREERTGEWPGTQIFNSLATVRHYRVCPESIAILRCVESFKDWLAPNYPEDLALYKVGVVVYSSIAHENEERHG